MLSPCLAASPFGKMNGTDLNLERVVAKHNQGHFEGVFRYLRGHGVQQEEDGGARSKGGARVELSLGAF